MKKFLKIILSLLLSLSMLFVVTACSWGNSFKKFCEEIQEAQNYTMTMSYSFEGIGKVTQTIHVDGNIMYYLENETLGTDEYYVQSIDDYEVVYEKKGIYPRWTKSIKEDNGINLEKNNIFNVDYYEKDKEEKNVYHQKKDIVFDNFDDVTISVLEDSMVIECLMTIDLSECEVKIVISEIGEHSLTLPEAIS